MSEYYVLSPTGERFGPARVDLLNLWAREGRVTAQSTVEQVETGERMPITSVPGFEAAQNVWQNPMPYSQPYTPVKNHMVKAVIATLCCCLPLGITSIVFASQVDAHARRGDIAAAEASAKKASMWANWSIGLAVAYLVFYVGYVVITGEDLDGTKFR